MLKDFKFDMPALVALILLGLFGFVIMFLLIKTGGITDSLLQTLVSVVMLAVGFYLGSSSDSRKKTDAMLSAPPPVSTTTTVTDGATVTRTDAPPALASATGT